MKKIFRSRVTIVLVLLLIAILVPSIIFANNEGSNVNSQRNKNEKPVFQNASVHDPSVMKVDDTYYVFGSHLAAAKSPDLMKWELVATGASPTNPLFEDVTKELKETFDWAQSDTLWAADVIQLKDGKFYMYYNACKGDSPRSALGVAVADDPEGHYKDLGIILKSGMWDEKGANGKIYDATVDPNVVDPDVFYDKDGKLWMVYGSYSGGIFILEMDPETAKPFPDQGYGKKLLGGNHSRIEGAYIQYSPETDYYYMFLSFGGLDAVGGYNIRVARSDNPDGPYVDAEGQDLINAKGKHGTFFDDVAIEPYGVKLMGNHLFTREPDESGMGIGTGYVSPGHNSTYYDEETGKHYIIFHTRFPNRGEEHQIRVHQMVMNADGWPVVAPHRYAGESLYKVSKNDIAGEYKFINHGKDISAEIKKSSNIQLTKNGKISGAIDGKWKKTGDYQVELTIDDITYDGIFISQYYPIADAYVMTFSALSDQGVAIWGSEKIENKE